MTAVEGHDDRRFEPLGKRDDRGVGPATGPGVSGIRAVKAVPSPAGLRSASVPPAIDAALARFPALAPRRKVRAGALSAGEQQMLGLALALVEEPRLLLVDELSMGLSPAVVGELVAALRALRDSGVTIIAAEQSVDVALALGGRACFLERGALRFDGRVEDLARRDDLLRPVFLRAAVS